MSEQFTKFSSNETNPNLNMVEDVQPDEVFAKRDRLHLIDVRRPDEFSGELGHAPGATLLTLDTLPENMEKIPKDKTVVFICRSGGRSGNATAMAKDQGFANVYNMKGGMLLWNEMGLETEGKPS